MTNAFPDPRDPTQLDDDVMHGLMAAHASESVGATIARVEPRRARSMPPMSMGPIAAILLMAVTLAVLVPLAISPSSANASEVGSVPPRRRSPSRAHEPTRSASRAGVDRWPAASCRARSRMWPAASHDRSAISSSMTPASA